MCGIVHSERAVPCIVGARVHAVHMAIGPDGPLTWDNPDYVPPPKPVSKAKRDEKFKDLIGRVHGEVLRAEGAAQADAAQPEVWRAAVDQQIAHLAALGQPFTADDVSVVVGDSPTGSQGAMGARFQAAAQRGLITRVGYVPSGRASVHAHPVAQWVGATAESSAARPV